MNQCVDAKGTAATLNDKTHAGAPSERIPAPPASAQKDPVPKNPLFESIRTAHKYLNNTQEV